MSRSDERAKLSGFRLQHAAIEGAPVIEPADSVADARGGRGAPLGRVVDTLRAMHKRGTLTDGQYAAGVAFQQTFARAHLDGLRAANLMRQSGGGGPHDLPHSAESARRKVGEIMELLGGHTTMMALAVYWIAGYGLTLKQFCEREVFANKRPLDNRAAGAHLVDGLQILAHHHEKRRNTRISGVRSETWAPDLGTGRPQP